MLRKTSTLAVAALISSASLAAAEEHTILYLGDAFFPSVSYVKPGDTVRFVNSSSAAMSIVGQDGAWSIGPVAVDSSDVIQINAATALQFFDADAQDEEGNLNVQGNLSFDPAPLG